MAAGGSAALSAQQERQLKEKLAVLKREYNKTFQRLQRAERAAKVKHHTRETVAEQNPLPGQEEAVNNHAGGLSQLSPGPPEAGQAGISCLSGTAETTPVLFKSGAFEGRSSEAPGSRRTHQSGRRALFNSVKSRQGRNCSPTSGTSRQQRERLSLAKEEEMAWEVHPGEHDRAADGGPESPVFQRSSSLLDPGQRSPAESSPPVSEGGSDDATPTLPDPECREGTLVRTDTLGLTQAPPCSLPFASQGSLLDPLSEEGVPGLEEKEKKQPRWVGMEDPGRLADPALPSSAAQGDGPVPNWHGDGMGNGDPLSKKRSGEDEGHSLEVGSPWLGGAIPEALSSCTVVEGLMFPLEYYVRMTRRLSRHQKEVNLEAVMQSQLGKGRKGRRVAHKEQVGNPTQPSQELPQSDDRLSSTPRVRGDASAWPPPLSPRSAGPSRGQGRRKLRRRTQQRTSSGTGRGCGPPLGSPDPTPPGPRRVDSSAAAVLPSVPLGREGPPLGWLPPGLPPQEFHLPDEEFGHLKSKKLKVCPEKPLGVWDAGGSSEGPPSPAAEAPLEEGAASGQILSRMRGTPSALPFHELLLSSAPDSGQSLLQPPNFPLVGATPASLGPSPSQAATALSSDRDGGRGRPRSPGPAGIGRKTGEDLAGPPEEPRGHREEPPRQGSPAEGGAPGEAPAGPSTEGDLEMTSKLKDGSGSSCLVDMGAVWWEAAGFTELRVVTAEEGSISLWRPLDLGQWETVHTWHFMKLPVIQVVPLSGAHSVVCAVLGRLETAEIRLLFHSSEDGSAEEQLLKAGNINAVLGLTDRKLVSNCWSLRGQEVEVVSFSEVGRSHQRWTLMPPEETVLAFADVAGLQEALLGMTAMNCIVLWNLGTGQLLKKIPVGWSFPASVCHRAYSDSGLLFMVFSHPPAKDGRLPGNPAFQVVALNPKTARSSGVTLLAPPPGTQGRYLERDVRGASAAAVLTSGTIAVWDVFLGRCTALLPPSSGASWSLARWSVTDTCLLAGQEDGSVYLYRYTGGLHAG